MLEFSVAHIGVYKREEKHVQTVNGPWLALHISGLVRSRVLLPDGRLLREFDRRAKPFLSIKLPGMKIDFEYGKKRENWVLMLHGIPFRYSKDFSCVEINCGEWVPIPFFTDIPEELVPGWRMEFKKMQEYYENPTPRNMFLLRLRVMDVFRRILEHDEGAVGTSPEEKLKALIDEDTTFSRDIAALSRSCGLSKDHLRVLFQKRYQTNPLAYRRQKRNARAMDLIANSALSVKEMSPLLGFRHVSHFCMDFQKSFGLSPLSAIKKYRYGA